MRPTQPFLVVVVAAAVGLRGLVSATSRRPCRPPCPPKRRCGPCWTSSWARPGTVSQGGRPREGLGWEWGETAERPEAGAATICACALPSPHAPTAGAGSLSELVRLGGDRGRFFSRRRRVLLGLLPRNPLRRWGSIPSPTYRPAIVLPFSSGLAPQLLQSGSRRKSGARMGSRSMAAR